MEQIKRRIIINVLDESIEDEDIVDCLKEVIKMGKIEPRGQYYGLTTFKNGLKVAAKLSYRSGSHVFSVYRDKK